LIAALICGELVADPVERATAKGGRYWTTTIRVPAGADAIFIGIGVFDEQAGERLAKLRKGSAIAAAGPLEQTAWTDREGNERRGWRLTAHEILSVNQARRRRDAEGATA
jgi:single-stranded DNA-binding protein